ncbi:MAG TPA: TlpA disulfide reductase family protein [Steroidobacteraceae bacterium]|nr:TlpA disulfide reductase family protein [Steroidobacteraceae bacterium]
MHPCTALAAALLLLVATSPPATASSAGGLLDLAAFRGQVVYLDFWASWCAPCRKSFPWMNHLQGELGHDGLVVVAVNVDRERDDAERFLHEHPAQFRIVYDPDGLLPEKFGVRGMPTSVLIDRNGHIQLRHEGFLVRDRDALTQQIRALVLAH